MDVIFRSLEAELDKLDSLHRVELDKLDSLHNTERCVGSLACLRPQGIKRLFLHILTVSLSDILALFVA